ncbi:hypothetical protein TNCT_516721 [Trichonephila clavata]|uniref:Uncharacterized protein n=1 Tax=Trichonephila clavata TaxID=2740835 RepID=A0A8X6G1D5_TRICU|nr:hypothetical protein TNCT_516721 [Trichonephila clavata]
MTMRMLSTFLLAAALIFSSCDGNLLKKVFCDDDSLLTEMEKIEKEVPEKFKNPALECMKKNSTKSEGLEFDCNGTTKMITPLFAVMYEDSQMFSDCVLKTLADVDKNLSEEEKKKVDELMEESKKIYVIFKEMEEVVSITPQILWSKFYKTYFVVIS